MYITKLRTQAAKCKFVVNHRHTYMNDANPPVEQVLEAETDISDQFIRDRLVCGIHDQNTRAKLLRERNLPLDSAIRSIKAVETANNHVQKLFNQKSALSVDKVNRRYSNKNFHQSSKSKP